MSPDVFLPQAKIAAVQAQHIFPDYAACEAALESAWGTSQLAVKANNLFGQKMGLTGEQYRAVTLPTHEYIHGVMIPTTAQWPMFPDWVTSFAERMVLLRTYAIYQQALRATTGEDFVTQVSKRWATDPNRATKVLSIYNYHRESLDNGN